MNYFFFLKVWYSEIVAGQDTVTTFFFITLCEMVFYLLVFFFFCSQLIEVSGKTQDECMVALHDCNEDVNRAINFLLESTSDTVSFDTMYSTYTDHVIHIIASCPEILLI